MTDPFWYVIRLPLKTVNVPSYRFEFFKFIQKNFRRDNRISDFWNEISFNDLFTTDDPLVSLTFLLDYEELLNQDSWYIIHTVYMNLWEYGWEYEILDTKPFSKKQLEILKRYFSKNHKIFSE